MNNLFTGKHITFLLICIAVLTIGYILLAQGPVNNPLSLSIAPLLLVGGYCVLIPAAILLKDDGRTKTKKKGV